MARDYAKNSRRGGRSAAAPRRAAPSSSSGRPLPGWIWLALGLAIGLVVAAFVYIGKSPRTAASPLAGIVTPATPPAATANKPIPLPPKQPSRFSFYEMLPSYEVVIPREDAAAAAKSGKAVTPDIAAPGQYLIQVGAYRTRDEADKGRASLALLGVESKIEQVTIDQTDTWFRVRIGPESSLQQAQEILERLEDNGIKGMLVKVKAG